MTVRSELQGAIGGASGEAGADYRRAVVAHLVSSALAGSAASLPFLPPEAVRLRAVALETDDPVDDIRAEYDTGHVLYIQAKLTLDASHSLRSAVAQWGKAAQSAVLDPEKHRLVVVTNQMTGTVAQLQRVLDRERADSHGGRTDAEQRAIGIVEGFLSDLDPDQRALVLRCAAIWKLEVAEPHTRDAIRDLGLVLAEPRDARLAYTFLKEQAGQLARTRTGMRIATWASQLRGAGFVLTTAGETPAAAATRRLEAIERYTARLQDTGRHIDLRGVGETLQRLPLEEADCGLDVRTRMTDGRSSRALLWSFLHHHRVVLEGLPGGGKSTAIRKLAADLADDDAFPIPLYVSLRDIDPTHPTTSFREQVVTAAVRDYSRQDRDELLAEMDARFDGDAPIAVLLDGLDETYDRHPAVVAAIDSFARSVSDNTFFLIATRAVTFAQAQTLTWEPLKLCPPKHSHRLTRAILQAAALRDGISDQSLHAWTTSKADWVKAHLDHDEALAETPLMVALLTLLASSGDTAELPGTRGGVLQNVVQKFIAGHEFRERLAGRFARLSPTELQMAGMQAFAREAHELVSHARASVVSVVDAITNELHPHWIQVPGQARATALEIVRAFDEAGVFVIGHNGEFVSPRVQLLAEIGDAMYVAEAPAHLDAWVRERAQSRQFESLALACLLTPDAVAACTSALDDGVCPDDLARIVAKAAKEGAEVSEPQLLSAASRLAATAARGTREGWRALRLLLDLPSVPESVANALADALASYTSIHQTLGAAMLRIRFQESFTSEDLELLSNALHIERLGTLPREDTGEAPTLWDLVDDGGLQDAQIRAADVMLTVDPELARVVHARVTPYASRGLINGLVEVLDAHGNSEIVHSIIDEYRSDDDSPSEEEILLAEAQRAEPYSKLLTLLADMPATPISSHQQVTLTSLGQFLQSLDAIPWGEHGLDALGDEFLAEHVRVVITLYGFVPGELAAQAQEVLRRIKRYVSIEPVTALDSRRRGDPVAWPHVDAEAVATHLEKALRLPDHWVSVPALLLAGGPRETVAPILRNAFEGATLSPLNRRLVAHAWLQVVGIQAATQWVTTDSPVLRRIAAERVPSVLDYDFLTDEDAGVQKEALIRLVEANPLNLRDHLNRFVQLPARGWTCVSCGAENGPPDVRGACEGCLTPAPDPLSVVKGALASLDLP